LFALAVDWGVKGRQSWPPPWGKFCLKSGHLGIKASVETWGSTVISNEDILPSSYCR
jgi:hypothetical protein